MTKFLMRIKNYCSLKKIGQLLLPRTTDTRNIQKKFIPMTERRKIS